MLVFIFSLKLSLYVFHVAAERLVLETTVKHETVDSGENLVEAFKHE